MIPDFDAKSVGPLAVGDVLEVTIGQVAHGGHFIAHANGRTIFVRHALPGESARIEITEVRAKIVRADAIVILEPSPDRVSPPCAFAGPQLCGGCDFQHISLSRQRALKQQVVADAFRRHARLVDLDIPVVPLAGDCDGLHWRTRVRWGVDSQGHVGFHAYRSNTILPVTKCVIATEGQGVVPAGTYPGALEVRSAEGSDGGVVIAATGPGPAGAHRVTQTVLGRRWQVEVGSFWQSHRGAPTALAQAVLAAGQPLVGETWWDLYSGVGLFSAYLAAAVGTTGSVVAVDVASRSVRDARRNLHQEVNIKLVEGQVDTWLASAAASGPVAGVVLDPPRTGAGPVVAGQIAARKPRVVVYVACDPVALARDVATFATLGYRLAKASGYDTFPMTHHVELVATLVPIAAADQIS
ncbi:MAG: TRAM domain-containing protein [Actinomycetota bacterium]|nr:TRAM domain-containing protein [Actinomycetota bacterium]